MIMYCDILTWDLVFVNCNLKGNRNIAEIIPAVDVPFLQNIGPNAVYQTMPDHIAPGMFV